VDFAAVCGNSSAREVFLVLTARQSRHRKNRNAAFHPHGGASVKRLLSWVADGPVPAVGLRTANGDNQVVVPGNAHERLAFRRATTELGLVPDPSIPHNCNSL
jgi:hypothetical protein